MGKERPILFSAPMVRAILDGQKTQTRRVMSPQPEFTSSGIWCGYKKNMLHYANVNHLKNGAPIDFAPYRTGDRLWVRETWQYYNWTEDGEPFIRYSADEEVRLCSVNSDEWGERVFDIWCDLSVDENYRIDGAARDRKWRPSIFMPQWASRIGLLVKDIRVEQLRDISKEDAIAEGVCELTQDTASMSFASLWDSINGTRKGCSWDDNPWVWVVEF